MFSVAPPPEAALRSWRVCWSSTWYFRELCPELRRTVFEGQVPLVCWWKKELCLGRICVLFVVFVVEDKKADRIWSCYAPGQLHAQRKFLAGRQRVTKVAGSPVLADSEGRQTYYPNLDRGTTRLATQYVEDIVLYRWSQELSLTALFRFCIL